MNQISELRQSILTTLSSASQLQSAQLSTAHNGTNRHLPVQHPMLFVGLDKLNLEPSGMGNLVGVVSEKMQQGQLAELTFRFDLEIPQTCDSSVLYILFEDLCWTLLQSDLGIHAIWCEPVLSQSVSLGSSLVAKATLKTYLSKQESLQEWSDFYVCYNKE